MNISEKERLRAAAQLSLEHGIPASERNKKGQFATPYKLALHIVKEAFRLCPKAQNVLEPSCGTGAFISAVRSLSDTTMVKACELDSRFFKTATSLWSDIHTEIFEEDFLNFQPNEKFDLLISNPPYSRHHHITKEAKELYGEAVRRETGVRISSLAGLHAYFILRGNELLSPDGYAFWLIPSELFSVNYGLVIKNAITSSKAVRRVHFFNSTELQFEDALVSSSVLVVQNRPANLTDKVLLTYGDFVTPEKIVETTISKLKQCPKWQHFSSSETIEKRIKLRDFFSAKRGIATGDNKFFVRSLADWASLGIDKEWLTPVVEPPRVFKGSVIKADHDGWPLETKLAVLSIDSSIQFEDLPPRVRDFLNTCSDTTKSSYIVRNRKLWYSVEKRKAAPIICTYMGRSNVVPFRFIRNLSKAIVLNSYLGLYPILPMAQEELDNICQKLNSIAPDELIRKSREYGGGLRKLEPQELLSICL